MMSKTKFPILSESDAPETAERMLDEAQVLALVPFGRTTLWRAEKDGRFPKSTYISPNRRAWFESDVIEWQRDIRGRGRSQQSRPVKKLKAVV
jgi:prophage regulatory protein